LAIVCTELFHFFGSRVPKTGTGLFVFRRRRQFIVTDQIGMSTDEIDFFVITGFLNRGD
jgi:hypothetical protein